MTQQLKIGALGAASITPVALIQPARQISEDVIVRAIAARDTERASAFALKYGIPEVLPTYEALVESDEIDTIYNALPIANHFEWSIRALRAGKHVLCEKTLAQNAKEARIMRDVARECNRYLVEAFHYIHHPLTQRLLELLQEGAIGDIESIESHFYASIPQSENDIRWVYELGGGSTMEIGCYAIHIARTVAGEEPEVRRAEARIGPPRIDVRMETDLLFPSGITGQLSWAMACELERADTALRVRGTSGTMEVKNPFAPHLGHTLTIETVKDRQVEAVPGDTTYLHQLRTFVALLRNGRPIPAGPEDAVANMQVIDDIYRAAGLPPRGTWQRE
jgi:predicted dehydrogenase